MMMSRVLEMTGDRLLRDCSKRGKAVSTDGGIIL